MLTEDPCNKCTSGCADECTCPEPIYVAASPCDEPVPFGCVRITENNEVYPCLGMAKGKSLSDLSSIIDVWKCEYETLKTKVKVSPSDKNAGYLNQKIVSGDCISYQIINQNGNEQLKPVIDFGCVLSKIVLLPGFCNAVSLCTPLPNCSPTTNLTIG